MIDPLNGKRQWTGRRISEQDRTYCIGLLRCCLPWLILRSARPKRPSPSAALSFRRFSRPTLLQENSPPSQHAQKGGNGGRPSHRSATASNPPTPSTSQHRCGCLPSWCKSRPRRPSVRHVRNSAAHGTRANKVIVVFETSRARSPLRLRHATRHRVTRNLSASATIPSSPSPAPAASADTSGRRTGRGSSGSNGCSSSAFPAPG